ncbi:hypothetical protein D1871_18840 [Nakamurella silvestris]|nr:hypothetical protein D1871_18840 [Nakamurella silvestris]
MTETNPPLLQHNDRTRRIGPRVLATAGAVLAVGAITAGTMVFAHRSPTGALPVAAGTTGSSEVSVHGSTPNYGVGLSDDPEIYSSLDGWTQEKSDRFAFVMNDIGKAGLDDPAGTFAATSVNWVTETGLVYWHGEMSQQAKKLISVAAQQGIHIEQVQVPFGEQQLMEAMSVVDKAFRAAGLNDLTTSGLNYSYSGLVVVGATAVNDERVQQRAREVADSVVPGIKLSFIPSADTQAAGGQLDVFGPTR